MKKTGFIFLLLSVYIVAAFAWWTYAHIKSSKDLYEKEIRELELLPYKASLDVRGAVDQEMFKDTVYLKEYFYINYPALQIQFDTESDPLYNYMILPTKAAVETIEQRYKKRVWMYGLEGIVMVGLLFWGIIWIYRSLQARLKLKRQQSNFLLSITHELKTPLASIKLYLETLLKRPNLERSQSEEMMKNAITDTTRLRDLVENLLMAAQLDSHHFSLNFSPVNISNLLQDTINKFVMPRNLANRLNLQISPNIEIKADAIAMEMVFSNLISNAFKYSPADKDVTIQLYKDGPHVVAQFADQGQGIAEADKKQLFNMFYRTEDENVRKTKGTGLGLYIVKNLLNLHQAQIFVNDNKPCGVIFEIRFTSHAA
ncbi:MAG: sensor histidine kinase [Bacteroidota bacterium]